MVLKGQMRIGGMNLLWAIEAGGSPRKIKVSFTLYENLTPRRGQVFTSSRGDA
jgi:hypothetical protein